MVDPSTLAAEYISSGLIFPGYRGLGAPELHDWMRWVAMSVPVSGRGPASDPVAGLRSAHQIVAANTSIGSRNDFGPEADAYAWRAAVNHVGSELMRAGGQVVILDDQIGAEFRAADLACIFSELAENDDSVIADTQHAWVMWVYHYNLVVHYVVA